MATKADWVRQDNKQAESIAAIGSLGIGILCIVIGYWVMRGQENAWVVTGLGVMFLVGFITGFIVRSRSTIEVFMQQRLIKCHSSTRFGSKVASFPFSDLLRIELMTFQVPEEVATASAYLLFRNGRKVQIPSVSFENGNLIAQELAKLTGAKVAVIHSDTR